MIFFENKQLSNLILAILGAVLLILGENVFSVAIKIIGVVMFVLGILELTQDKLRLNIVANIITIIIGGFLFTFDHFVYEALIKLLVSLVLAYSIFLFYLREKAYKDYYLSLNGIVNIIIMVILAVILLFNSSINILVRLLGLGLLYTGLSNFSKMK